MLRQEDILRIETSQAFDNLCNHCSGDPTLAGVHDSNRFDEETVKLCRVQIPTCALREGIENLGIRRPARQQDEFRAGTFGSEQHERRNLVSFVHFQIEQHNLWFLKRRRQ